jgi:hypothetical protein
MYTNYGSIRFGLALHLWERLVALIPLERPG